MELNGLMDIMNMGDSGANDPIDRIFSKYKKMRTQEAIANFLGNKFIPDRQNQYADQNQALDIQMKRRSLGLPMDEDIYEDWMNRDQPESDSSFKTMFAVKGMKNTPMEHIARNKPNMFWEAMGDLGKSKESINNANQAAMNYHMNEAIADHVAGPAFFGNTMSDVKNTAKGVKNGSGFFGLLKRFHK